MHTPRVETTRILLADDYPLVREGVRALLTGEPEFAVVAEAGTASGVVAAQLSQRPDLILLDLQLGDADGLQICQRLTYGPAAPQVVIMANNQEDGQLPISAEMVPAARSAGAVGFVLKDAGAWAILAALRQARAGRDLMHTEVYQAAMLQFEPITQGVVASRGGLSPMEHALLEQIASGQTYRTIAYALALSEYTVRHYASYLFDKLGVSNRDEAAWYAHNRHLV